MQLQGGAVGSRSGSYRSGGWALRAPNLRVFNVFLRHRRIQYLLTARALASALLLAIKIIADVCVKWQMRQGKYYTCGVQIRPRSLWSLITRVFGCVRVRGFSSVSLSELISHKQAGEVGKHNLISEEQGRVSIQTLILCKICLLGWSIVWCQMPSLEVFAFQGTTEVEGDGINL